MTPEPTRPDHHQQLHALTRNHTMATRFTYQPNPKINTTVTRNHTVKVPPLLTQLGWIAPTGRGDDRASGGYESRPAAALESLNILVEIDTRAGWWLRRFGESDWGDTPDLLVRVGVLTRRLETSACHRRRLHRDKITDAPCCAFHHLTNDIARWWTQARVATGWDQAAWRPDNSCPMCGVRGSLRVKEADKIGFCVECHETWTPDTIGLLAEHIRTENATERRTIAAASLCWCPVPQPTFGRWPALCPACGSRYCHRAVDAAKMSA